VIQARPGLRALVVGHLRDPLYRQSYLMLAGTAVSAATGMAFWMLAARITDAAVVGLAAGIVAAVGFLSYLTSLALPYGLLRFARVTPRLGRVVNMAVGVSALASVVAGVAYCAGAGWWAPKLAGLLRDPVEVALFALAGAGAAAGLLVDNVLAARRRGGAALVRNTVAGVGKLVLLPLMADQGPSGVYLAMMLPMAVSAAGALVLLPKLVPDSGPWDLGGGPEVRALFGFSLRNFPAALASGAPMFLLPVIAAARLDPAANAYFYVAWTIGQVVQLVPSVVANMTLSEGATEGAYASAVKAERFVLTLLVPGCLLLGLLAGVALGLYGSDYAAGAATPLRCFIASAVPWAIVVIHQSRLRVEGRLREVTVLTLVLCVLSLGLPLGLVGWLGVAGLGYGWLGGAALTALVVSLRRAAPETVAS
jgi:O-antigen/teichoic acid export membrane protein